MSMTHLSKRIHIDFGQSFKQVQIRKKCDYKNIPSALATTIFNDDAFLGRKWNFFVLRTERSFGMQLSAPLLNIVYVRSEISRRERKREDVSLVRTRSGNWLLMGA